MYLYIQRQVGALRLIFISNGRWELSDLRNAYNNVTPAPAHAHAPGRGAQGV